MLLSLRRLLGKLGSLDAVLNILLLLSPLLPIAPPSRSLVVASQP